MSSFNQLESTEYLLYNNNIYFTMVCVMYSDILNMDFLIKSMQ